MIERFQTTSFHSWELNEDALNSEKAVFRVFALTSLIKFWAEAIK